jgi:ADP-ribose pyrophosphatase
VEETGYEAKQMKPVAAGPPSAGMSDEVITLFVAKGLKKVGEPAGDGSEDITLHEVPLDRVPAFLKRKLKEGCLIDLKIYGGLHFLSATAAKEMSPIHRRDAENAEGGRGRRRRRRDGG